MQQQPRKATPAALLIVYFAMLAMAPTMFIVHFVVARSLPEPRHASWMVLAVTTFFAGMSWLLGLFWMYFFNSISRLKKFAYGPNRGELRLPDDFTPADRFLARAQVNMIIACACCESLGVYGVVMPYLGGPPILAYGMIAVSMLGFLLLLPGVLRLLPAYRELQSSGLSSPIQRY